MEIRDLVTAALTNDAVNFDKISQEILRTRIGYAVEERKKEISHNLFKEDVEQKADAVYEEALVEFITTLEEQEQKKVLELLENGSGAEADKLLMELSTKTLGSYVGKATTS